MYMDKDLIEDKLYWIIDQFNEKKITPTKFYSILLNEIHPFSYGNGRTCKTLFATEDKNNLCSRCIDCSFKENFKNLNYI